MTDTTQSTGQTAADAALSTLQAMAPTLISAAAAGAAASSPGAAAVAALMPVAMQMYEANAMNAQQLQGLVDSLVTTVEGNQAKIDAYAKSRGVSDPSQP